jgi:hypothetical protein
VAGARVRVYFASSGALARLQRGPEQATPQSGAERRATSGFLERLGRTLDLLALRALLPAGGAELRIDATDSGFVHWSGCSSWPPTSSGGAPRSPSCRRDEPKRRMLEQIVRYGLSPTSRARR